MYIVLFGLYFSQAADANYWVPKTANMLFFRAGAPTFDSIL